MLPIIDISDLSQQNSKKLVNAASTHGFLLLEKHWLDKETIDTLFSLSKQFFNLPMETKKKFTRTPENDGYVAPMVEDLQQDGTGKGDPKEAFNITHFNLIDFLPHQKLPDILKENQDFIASCLEKYYNILHRVCKMLAIGLDIKDNNGDCDSEFFVNAHALNLKTRSALRLLHYPKPNKEFENENLAGAHTDYGSLTFVLQKPHKGLQIFDGSQWENVVVPQHNGEELLIVNIADMLSFWTNGYLKSTLHRVRSTEERYSVVFFCQPADTIVLEPVNSEIIRNYDGDSYYLNKDGKPLTSLEHLLMKFQQGYGKK